LGVFFLLNLTYFSSNDTQPGQLSSPFPSDVARFFKAAIPLLLLICDFLKPGYKLFPEALPREWEQVIFFL